MKLSWNHYAYIGQFDSLLQSIKPFFWEAFAAEDSTALLYSGATITQAYLMLDNADSAKFYLHQLIPYENAEVDPQLCVFFNNIAGSYALKFNLDYTSALNRFENAYECAVQGNDLNNQAIMLANIVNIFYVRSDKQGMRYAKRVYDISQSGLVNPFVASLGYVAMAQMTSLSGDYKSTMEYLHQLDALPKDNRTTLLMPVIDLLYADTYYAYSDYFRAQSYYEKALQYSFSVEPSMLSKIYLNYGNFCEARADYEKAMALYSHGLELSYNHKNLEFRRELLYRMSSLQYKLGNKVLSLEYYQQFRTHLDSVSNTKREQEFNALLLSLREVEHESEMRAKELALLKANQRLIYVGAFSSLVIIVLIFVWLLYSRKQKMYRALAVQHQKHMQELGIKNLTVPAPTAPVVTKEVSGESPQDERSADLMLFKRLEDLMADKTVLFQKDLSLDKIAEMLATNRTYVSRAINEVAGMPYYSYIDMYRIREATKIISESEEDIPFKQLSDDLGYNSISVFYKAFRNATGCTPGQYRDQIRQIRKNR